MKKNFAQRHPDWFAISVYEDPENLIPVFSRILSGSVLITLVLNSACGYTLSEYRSSPWVQELMTYALGLSEAFATRFHDLQGLTQAGGYYYVGAMVVSLISAVITSALLIAAYAQITLRKGRARPFNLHNLKGVLYGSFCAFLVIFFAFFARMETGSYLGMSRVFFPGAFPAIAALSGTFCAMMMTQSVVFALKMIGFWRKLDG